jgi:hypothetical protein
VEGTYSDGVGRQPSRAKNQTASARSPGPRHMWPRRRLPLPSNAPGLGRERHLGAASNVQWKRSTLHWRPASLHPSANSSRIPTPHAPEISKESGANRSPLPNRSACRSDAAAYAAFFLASAFAAAQPSPAPRTQARCSPCPATRSSCRARRHARCVGARYSVYSNFFYSKTFHRAPAKYTQSIATQAAACILRRSAPLAPRRRSASSGPSPSSCRP